MTTSLRRLAPLLLGLAAAACSRDVNVPAQNALVAVPDSLSVAPREQRALGARGGAGGYRFAWAAGSPQSGPLATLDAATGAYRAGAAGSCRDDVEIVDAAGQVATVRIAVGAALSLAATGTSVPTGGGVLLTAAGGLQPYRFGFAPRGNRSAGSIDAVTGAYAAGLNAGTSDLVEVTDAAGAVAALAVPLQVGGPRVAVPGGVGVIRAGDLNGDGRQDLVFVEPASGAPRRITTAELPAGAAPIVETYWSTPATTTVGAYDLDGSGRADLLVGGSAAQIWLGAPSGSLVLGPGLGGYTPSDALAVDGKYYGSSAACRVTRVDWGASGPAPVCAFPAAAGPYMGPLVTLATGDLSGEGNPDVVFVSDWVSQANNVGPPMLRFSFDVGSATTQTPGLSPNAGRSLILLNGGLPHHQLATGWFSTPARGTVAALVSNAARNVVDFTSPWFGSGSPTWSSLEIDPFPGEETAIGIAACAAPPGGSQGLLAFNGTGRLALLSFDAGTVGTTVVDAAPFPIAAAACADVNGDGIPDLVLAGASAAYADVSLGDGDGGFGRRPRFGVAGAVAIGDLDGDGVADLVTGTGSPGLLALLGGSHQYAVGPETPVGAAAELLAAGDLTGTHGAGWKGDVVFQSPLGEQFLARGSGDGTFAAPDPLPAYTGATGDARKLDAIGVAELGGTAPGRDVVGWHVVPTPQWSQINRYPNGAVQLVGLVRDAGGTRRITAALSGAMSAVQPLDRDGDGVDDAIALLQYVSAPAGMLPGPTSITVLAGGAAGFDPVYHPTNITVTGTYRALGQIGGEALFDLGTGQLFVVGTGSYRDVPSPVSTYTSAVIASPVPGQPPRLLVTDGAGAVLAYQATLDGQGHVTAFTALQSLHAPGVLAGVAPQGPGLPADVLLRSGGELLPLVHDGPGGTLR
jgi:hypothetical protein